MDDPEVNAAVEILTRSTDVQELQTALMNFALRVDANSCSQILRQRLWKAVSGNSKFWQLFSEEKDPTLPQLATHTLASFAGDEFLPRWPKIVEILPKLASRIKDFEGKDKIPAIESYSKDILLICLSCAQVPHMSLSVACSLLLVSKVLPRSSFVAAPQFFQYVSDTMRGLVIPEKWYKDGTTRSSFTWAVNLGLSLFIDDQSASKFEYARLTGAVLLNASPTSSFKHRSVVVDSFLPETMKVPLADNVRSVFLSRSLTVSKKHVSAILVLTSGLQRWLCRGDGDFWLFSAGSKLLSSQEDRDKMLPMLSVHCSTEFVRITTKSTTGSDGKTNISPDDDQALAASLQLMEDMLEFIVLQTEEFGSKLPSTRGSKALSSAVLLETHRCLREATISAIEHLVDETFEQPDNTGIYSETGGLKLACFRWACRFVAQDAASMDGDLLAAFVRYGVAGLSRVSTATAGLIPMFAAALGNVLSLDGDDKGKVLIDKCFVSNQDPSSSNEPSYVDKLLALADGAWKQKAVEVDSAEGHELLSSLKEGLEKLKQEK